MICCLLFVLHQIAQKIMGLPIPLIDSYLDSLLAMPIILGLLLWERRVLFRKGNHYRLSGQEVTIATLFIAFVSEIVFPWLSQKFTFDWPDLLLYTTGSIIFWLTMNKEVSPSERKEKTKE